MNWLMFGSASLNAGAAVWALTLSHNWKMAVVYAAFATANFVLSTIG